MATKELTKGKARFDTRLPTELKRMFERAARLAGHRSLTDFVILTVRDKAEEIIENQKQILASEKDSEIFFNAVLKSDKPNKNLVKALKDYNAILSK